VTAPTSATALAGTSALDSGRTGRPSPWGARGGLGWLVAVAALAFFATAQYTRQLFVDTYFDLYTGRYVAQHGIPRRNVVTVVAHGKPWIDQQWLGQLSYYRAWQLGGYPAVVLLSLMLVAVGFAILGALMLRRDASPLRVCAWALAAFAVSFGYATPRAQSFGYLFFPLLLWLVLTDDKTGPPRLLAWLSIPLLVVWANVHGSVLLGAGFVGLHAAGRVVSALRRRDIRALTAYLLLGTCAALTLICTPYGFGVARYYGSLIGNSELAAAGTEWTPPNPAHADSWAFFAVVIAVAVTVTLGWRRGARPQPELAIFAAVTLGVALLAFRNTPWFAFAGCLLAADMHVGSAARVAVAASFRRVIASALTACAVIAGIGIARTPASHYEASVPHRAINVAAQIAARQPGLAVLSDQWGAVGLLWFHPALIGRVAFDVRAEQYSQAQLGSLIAFMSASGSQWQQLLRGYDLVVVSRRWHPRLALAMTQMAGWRVVYSDNSGVVAERYGLTSPRR
jgi:hypothetical protein